MGASGERIGRHARNPRCSVRPDGRGHGLLEPAFQVDCDATTGQRTFFNNEPSLAGGAASLGDIGRNRLHRLPCRVEVHHKTGSWATGRHRGCGRTDPVVDGGPRFALHGPHYQAQEHGAPRELSPPATWSKLNGIFLRSHGTRFLLVNRSLRPLGPTRRKSWSGPFSPADLLCYGTAHMPSQPGIAAARNIYGLVLALECSSLAGHRHEPSQWLTSCLRRAQIEPDWTHTG